MGTTSAAPAPTLVRQETAEERFQRLRQEARELNPQDVGPVKEIVRDMVSTLKVWSKTRRRANKIA